jgi:AcrR family transcriptional regulator
MGRNAISDTQILEAALDVLAQQGYVGATTRQIAAAAGINEVTLFRRFGSKQNVLKIAIEQEAVAFAAAGIEYSGDVTADLLRVVRFYQQIVHERGPVIMVLMTEVPRHQDLRELMQTPMAIMANIIALIERYQTEGVLIREPPLQAFTALVGGLLLAGILQYAQNEQFGEPLDPELLVRNYLTGRMPSPAGCNAATPAR